jgi:ribosomal protein S18 acetylase RimI-like enzyme
VTTTAAWAVRRLAALDDRAIAALADVLVDCVDAGASVGFLRPLAAARAVAFWRRVATDVAAGKRMLFTAEDEAGICGTVQVVPAAMENQPHRADLSKLLVHRRARRRGMGAALMRAAEAEAHAQGRTLLVLDTASADAERLYDRLGWQRVGTIPRYALMPDGAPCATMLYYRDLA